MTYEAALKEHYASIRSRLAPPPPPRKRIVLPLPVLSAMPEETSLQRWRRERAQKRLAAEVKAAAEEPEAEVPLIPIGDPLNMLAKPGWMFILHYVAKKYHLAPLDLTGKLRFTKIVRARQEAMWLIHKHCTRAGNKLSLPDIGRRFGRDHTTVLHSIRAVEKRRSQARREVSPTINSDSGKTPEELA